MVRVSNPPIPMSGPVGEWVWPNPSNPGEVRFIPCDEREIKLWDLLKQSG
jgi:hypothetical protein